MLSVALHSVTWYDSACDSKMAAGLAADLRMRDEVDVYLGPPCSDGKRTPAVLHTIVVVLKH